MSKPRRGPTRVYDHRLRELVRHTGDLGIATDRGVPRSTAVGWRRASVREVITLEEFDRTELDLHAERIRLRRRVAILATVVRLLVTLVRWTGPKLESRHLTDGARDALLGAVEQARRVLKLRSILRILGLSSSRFHGWARPEPDCHVAEATRCPRRTPNQLTGHEVRTIREMVTAAEYRHVPTSRLAILAQRLGRVFAAPATWAKLVRAHGWRRPRTRVHPDKPKVGLRNCRPNEAWHIDTTLIRLLDGTKAYVHAVIDNFSRRILAFQVADRMDVANVVAVLAEAASVAVRVTGAPSADTPMLVVDGGVENFNAKVDELLVSGVLRRVLALTDLSFSNSMIEAYWRTMKHQWLFLNTLDSVGAVRRLVTFYVAAHNSQVPHSAFRGQTPDEVYFSTGAEVPISLQAARKRAQRDRSAANRGTTCGACTALAPPTTETRAVA